MRLACALWGSTLAWFNHNKSIKTVSILSNVTWLMMNWHSSKKRVDDNIIAVCIILFVICYWNRWNEKYAWLVQMSLVAFNAQQAFFCIMQNTIRCCMPNGNISRWTRSFFRKKFWLLTHNTIIGYILCYVCTSFVV